MNILLVSQQSSIRHNIPAYHFWSYYFKNGIQEYGANTVEISGVDWAEGLIYRDREQQEAWRKKTWPLALEKIKKYHQLFGIDLFLSYLYPQQIDENAIREITSIGIPTVNFFCDNIREFTQVPKEFKVFDINWVPEFEALSLYKKEQIHTIHAPMPMWVPLEFRGLIDASQEKSQVLFIGSKDLLRARLVHKVSTKSNIPLKIMGAGWNEHSYSSQSFETRFQQRVINQFRQIKNVGLMAWGRKFANRALYSMPNSNSFSQYIHSPPTQDEYFFESRHSAVTLGINRYPSDRFFHSNPHKYSRLRDIEAPMLGACYLTEYAPGLEYLYDLGTEIEVYRNEDELIIKAEQLIADEHKRLRLRMNGQKKALAKHTISNTLNRIFAAI